MLDRLDGYNHGHGRESLSNGYWNEHNACPFDVLTPISHPTRLRTPHLRPFLRLVLMDLVRRLTAPPDRFLCTLIAIHGLYMIAMLINLKRCHYYGRLERNHRLLLTRPLSFMVEIMSLAYTLHLREVFFGVKRVDHHFCSAGCPHTSISGRNDTTLNSHIGLYGVAPDGHVRQLKQNWLRNELAGFRFRFATMTHSPTVIYLVSSILPWTLWRRATGLAPFCLPGDQPYLLDLTRQSAQVCSICPFGSWCEVFKPLAP